MPAWLLKRQYLLLQRVVKKINSGSCLKSKSSDADSEDEITVQSLRKDRKSKLIVHKELSKLVLKSNSEDTSSDSSSSDVSSSFDSADDEYASISAKRRRKIPGKKKKKTGISAKSSDKVKFPQKWSHAHLTSEYVNRHLKFVELDLKLFVFRELELLLEGGLPKAEQEGRLDLLKKEYIL